MEEKANILVFWRGRLKKSLINLGLEGCDRMPSKGIGRENMK